MPKLDFRITPDVNIAPPVNYSVFEVAGGLPRVIQESTSIYGRVSVFWTLGAQAFDAFETFFRNDLNNGNDSFTIDLAFQTANPSEHDAILVSDSLKLTSVDGHTFRISAVLEVKEINVDVVDEFALATFETYGGYDMSQALLSLSELVNEVMPEEIGA